MLRHKRASNCCRTGIAFLQLYNYTFKNEIVFDESVYNADNEVNLQRAFDLFEQKLGVPQLLKPEDVTVGPLPDVSQPCESFSPASCSMAPKSGLATILISSQFTIRDVPDCSEITIRDIPNFFEIAIFDIPNCSEILFFDVPNESEIGSRDISNSTIPECSVMTLDYPDTLDT